jgi:hypothetical protein
MRQDQPVRDAFSQPSPGTQIALSSTADTSKIIIAPSRQIGGQEAADGPNVPPAA